MRLALRRSLSLVSRVQKCCYLHVEHCRALAPVRTSDRLFWASPFKNLRTINRWHHHDDGGWWSPPTNLLLVFQNRKTIEVVCPRLGSPRRKSSLSNSCSIPSVTTELEGEGKEKCHSAQNSTSGELALFVSQCHCCVADEQRPHLHLLL